MLGPQDFPVVVQKDDGITLSPSHDAACKPLKPRLPPSLGELT